MRSFDCARGLLGPDATVALHRGTLYILRKSSYSNKKLSYEVNLMIFYRIIFDRSIRGSGQRHIRHQSNIICRSRLPGSSGHSICPFEQELDQPNHRLQLVESHLACIKSTTDLIELAQVAVHCRVFVKQLYIGSDLRPSESRHSIFKNRSKSKIV